MSRLSRHSRSPRPQKQTGGRALIALANALLVFATGCAIWLLLLRGFTTTSEAPPFMPVVIFAAIMGALSFVLEINVVPAIFFRIWKLLGRLFSNLY